MATYSSADPARTAVGRLFALFYHGHEAVDVFIVLSGFCLMLPVVRGRGILEGGVRHFFEKRARRILPPYYLAFGLCLILCRFLIGHKTGTLWDTCLPVTAGGIAAHLLLMQDLFRRTIWQADGPLWSISVEWRIYLVFPLLVLAWRRWGGAAATAAAVLFSLLLVRLLVGTPLDITKTDGCCVSPQYLGLFAMGMFGAGVAFSPEPFFVRCRALPWGGISAGLLLPTLAVLTIPLPGHGPVPFYRSDYLVGLWAMSLMIVPVLSPQGRWNRLLSSRPLVFIGSFAFSLYLLHQPLLQLFWLWALRPLGLLAPPQVFAGEVLAGLPIILALCYLFFLVCERPFLSRRSVRRKTPSLLS